MKILDETCSDRLLNFKVSTFYKNSVARETVANRQQVKLQQDAAV
jgi:hypothetical protein